GLDVYVSEPFARKTGLSVGDAFDLDTPQGTVSPRVAAVLRDYGNERGAITMDLGQMDRWFGAGDPHGAALYLDAGADLDEVTARVELAAAEYGVTVRPNRFLRANALEVFDQTFRITLILQAMALVVATVGVMLTLFVLGYDEAGVLALYRALGATRGQVFRFFVAKGIAIALIGTVLGLAAGAALAWLLIFVTNPSYFGWSLDAHVPGLQILGQVGWILGAAALASIYPAFLASRPQPRALNPIEA
ncbi:MAG: ABC transporter permease, partial [Longimicrobiales bacterium]